MSDVTLRDAAETELRLTTAGWNKVKNYSPEQLAATHWGKGLDLLAQISQANDAPRDQAIVYLKKTTRGYSPTATNWKLAFAELAKIVDTATGWTKVANEFYNFTLGASSEVRYGVGSAWNTKVLNPGTYLCGNALFGDPAVGLAKVCEARPAAPPPPGSVYPSNTLYPSEVSP